MGNNPVNDADETNKPTKSEVTAGFAVAPTADEVLSLREAARQLARLAPSKKGEKIADAKLLQLLKAGKVRAGFHAPGITPIWVQVPSGYWLTISSATFKKIRVQQSSGRKGEFKVRLKSFPSEYAAARSTASAGAPSAADLLLEFLQHEDDFFEITLPLREWEDHKKLLPEPLAEFVQDNASKEKTGRSELASWKNVNAILAVYLLKRNIRSSDDESCDSIATSVLDIAARMNVIRPPSHPTLEKEVGRVLGLINSSEFESISSVNSFGR
jgi:hypothetical protein